MIVSFFLPTFRALKRSKSHGRDHSGLPVSKGSWSAGWVALAIGLAATSALVLHRLKGLELPGCGPDGPCDLAEASRWGRVAGWPASSLGFAAFAALAAGWALTRTNGVSSAFRLAVRAGTLVSLMYLLVIALGSYFCLYCLATHAAMFGFWAVVERTERPPRPQRSGRPLVLAGVVFVLTTAGLGMADRWGRDAADRRAEQEVQASIDRVVETSRPGGLGQDSDPTDLGFSGRYRLGPEQAVARLVIFSDYQCPNCRRLDNQARALLQGRTDVSLSIKHYPLCSDCNPFVPSSAPHRHACQAARAVEAAGLVEGTPGFWRMHDWLFERAGAFSEDELRAALPDLGFERVDRFLEVMDGEETLQRVQADIKEGASLGLERTPLIFLNGVELRGWQAEQALERAVFAVADRGDEPRSAQDDRPQTGAEKILERWQREPAQIIPPPQATDWTRGVAEAPREIVVFGDYQHEETAMLDRILNEAVAGRENVRQSFRHFPLGASCNRMIPQDVYPQSCEAARAAEAAGELAGAEGFWKMHAWLLEHQDEVRRNGRQAFKQAAEDLGIDPAALTSTIGLSRVDAAISEDVEAAIQIGVDRSPMLLIDGRKVIGWNTPGALDQILDAPPPQ